MATIKKLPSGNWRVQARRKGRYIAETFRRHKEAEAWALDMERRIDQGEVPSSRTRKKPTTFGDLIDLHLAAISNCGFRLQSNATDGPTTPTVPHGSVIGAEKICHHRMVRLVAS